MSEEDKNKNKEYQHNYYTKNKASLNASQQSKVKCCLCNKIVCKNFLTAHKKTKYCRTKSVSDTEQVMKLFNISHEDAILMLCDKKE